MALLVLDHLQECLISSMEMTSLTSVEALPCQKLWGITARWHHEVWRRYGSSRLRKSLQSSSWPSSLQKKFNPLQSIEYDHITDLMNSGSFFQNTDFCFDWVTCLWSIVAHKMCLETFLCYLDSQVVQVVVFLKLVRGLLPHLHITIFTYGHWECHAQMNITLLRHAVYPTNTLRVASHSWTSSSLETSSLLSFTSLQSTFTAL